MENKDQIELLADTAMKSKNYNQAYDYFSQLLEKDTNNKSYWIGKSLSSGYLSTVENMRISETVACGKVAEGMELTKNESIDFSNKLISLFDSKIRESITAYDNEVEKEFNALQIPAGTLYSVHQMRKTTIKYKVGEKYRPLITEHLDILVLASDLNPTKENYIGIIEKINFLFKESSNNDRHFFGALNDLTETNSKIKKIWDDSDRKIRKFEPNYQVESQSPQAGNSGCFIATAVTGDYDHPIVLQLRNFRDYKLQKNNLGRKFIKFYYLNSPPIANFIRDKKMLKKILYFSFIKPLGVFTRFITK